MELRLRACLLLSLVSFVLIGCGQPESNADLNPPFEDSWSAVYIGGAKAGYSRTIRWKVDEGGRPAIRIENVTQLGVLRAGDETRVGVSLVSWETPAGRLLRFAAEERLGSTPKLTTGVVQDDQLILATPSGGREEMQSLAFPQGAGGFNAVDDSLLDQPMRPGERRTLQTLVPVMNLLATVELRAIDWETINLLNGPALLLRIDQHLSLPGGQAIDSVAWTNEQGRILKQRIDAAQQEFYAVSEQEALAPSDQPPPDLFALTMESLNRPLPAGHRTLSATYRVELSAGDPTRIFPNSATQSVRAIGPNVAEIAVRALDASAPTTKNAGPADAPTDADRRPSEIAQSDDPRIVEMARAAAPADAPPRAVVGALEKFVREKVTRKNYSQGFTTAADVAASLEGDCTEHAVLLVALLRARGIPARAALGLVYVEPPAMAFHMWTEAYLDGVWIPLDGTLGQGGIGAGHIKLAHASLENAGGMSAALAIFTVIGRLKIEIIEATPAPEKP